MAADAHAQAEPDRTEEIRKLPQAEELQLEHRIHLHQDGTLGVSSGGGQKVHTVCTRLFEHVYTGTRADRKKALEASDISSLVRETERSLQGGTLPNTQQRTRIFFVLMFMLRGIPFVDLAYLHKRDLQGNVLSYRRRKTGRALTVSLTPEAMQMVRWWRTGIPIPPICFPSCRARRYGSGIPGIPVGTQGIQPAAGSTQAVPGNAVGTQYLCSQTHLGHNGLPLRDTPRNHIGSHGTLLHHGDGNLSEAFQQQKD